MEVLNDLNVLAGPDIAVLLIFLKYAITMFLDVEIVLALTLTIVIFGYNHVTTMMPATTRRPMDAAACPTVFEVAARLRGEGLSFSCRT